MGFLQKGLLVVCLCKDDTHVRLLKEALTARVAEELVSRPSSLCDEALCLRFESMAASQPKEKKQKTDDESSWNSSSENDEIDKKNEGKTKNKKEKEEKKTKDKDNEKTEKEQKSKKDFFNVKSKNSKE